MIRYICLNIYHKYENKTSVYRNSPYCQLFAATAQEVKKTYFVSKPGTLISMMTEEEANQVTHLTLTGKINAVDFRHLRDEFKNLQVLDIANASISMYSGKEGTYPDKFYIYMPNFVPAYAFCKMENGHCQRKIHSEKDHSFGKDQKH